MKKNLLFLSVAIIFGVLLVGWGVSAQDKTPASAAPQDTGVNAPEPMGEMLTPPDDQEDGPGFSGRGFLMMQKELGLTQAQLDSLGKLRTAHMKEMIDVQAGLKKAEIDMAELMKTRGNDAAVLAKAKEISALRARMAEAMIQHRLAARAVFTDEQWQKIGSMRGAMMMRGRMQGRMQGRMGSFQGRGMMDGRGYGMHQRGSARGFGQHPWAPRDEQ